MKRNRIIAFLAAAAALMALLCACQYRKTPRPIPTRPPTQTPGPVATPMFTTNRTAPSYPAGKTASQDTKGAFSTLPEEAGR